MEQIKSSGHHDENGALQDVLIIGGGVAGLATALALHRMGLKPMVLERSPELQTAGAGIGLWTNAWKALEALGVADGLRKFGRISGFEFLTSDGNPLSSLDFEDVGRAFELRAVDRKALLEALRDPLPDDMISYGVQVTNIRKLDGGYTEVQCKNGQKIRTKVLIGCDGVKSVVAKWMDFKEVKHAGYTAIQGLATLPEGHNVKPVAQQILGKGIRFGIIPMDSKTVYWFVVFNSRGERITDPALIRQEALMHVRGCTNPMIRLAIEHSALESLSKREITDRWMWPSHVRVFNWSWGLGPALYQGGVTLAGDAMHPLTPNLGQGGCCALEDAVVLARLLGNALSSSSSPSLDGHEWREMERIEMALKTYTEERWPRILPIAIQSYLIGAMMQVENGLLCSLRNALLPRLMSMDRLTAHTFYDCGSLPLIN